ncbi:hypothetical protein PXH78_26940 [Mycolicibacterium smegmatis]|uniref:hypothetical protein n=1 Tax=Mycolicibacterium smegmatis TaxID=1772 RepID=UPI0005D7B6F5|nr:hypothetical protein [Mycolicibacterium smegmatis]MDF1902749.1 hypothetical protein [Mycolicibacterium smegmatis]MDF1909025.1 hypothetical protein [Mycolicibacterium smegmatis]MDF1921244.1 hypothetical protein [Mycolicibacterium smegmatis]MDF1927509.1 hypothetical protein [Mycolicibacterium smegmatis]UAK53366.1 hypothetical protein K8P01_22500 [Mycolicibacterium smegmatis]
MAVSITYDDLSVFAPSLDEEKAEAMIADALAMAARVAPCILEDDLTDAEEAAVKAILRGAILRWNDQGTSQAPQLVAGPFQYIPRSAPRRSLLLPSEIRELSKICGQTSTRSAFTVDMIPEDEDE